MDQIQKNKAIQLSAKQKHLIINGSTKILNIALAPYYIDTTHILIDYSKQFDLLLATVIANGDSEDLNQDSELTQFQPNPLILNQIEQTLVLNYQPNTMENLGKLIREDQLRSIGPIHQILTYLRFIYQEYFHPFSEYQTNQQGLETLISARHKNDVLDSETEEKDPSLNEKDELLSSTVKTKSKSPQGNETRQKDLEYFDAISANDSFLRKAPELIPTDENREIARDSTSGKRHVYQYSAPSETLKSYNPLQNGISCLACSHAYIASELYKDDFHCGNFLLQYFHDDVEFFRQTLCTNLFGFESLENFEVPDTIGDTDDSRDYEYSFLLVDVSSDLSESPYHTFILENKNDQTLLVDPQSSAFIDKIEGDKLHFELYFIELLDSLTFDSQLIRYYPQTFPYLDESFLSTDEEFNSNDDDENTN